MKKKQIIYVLAIMAILSSCSDGDYNYPVTKKGKVVDDYFGTKVADPYRWLEDDNSEETKSWVNAQNKVTFDYLDGMRDRKKIKKRLTEIFDYEKFGTPFERDGKYFFFKNNGLQNQSVLFMQGSSDINSKAKVLLDPNSLSNDGTVALKNYSVSKDGKYLAYSTATAGSDWEEITVMEISTRKIIDKDIKWVKFSGITWHGNGFYYGRFPKPKEGGALTKSNLNKKIYYHKVGTPQSADKIIYENKDQPKMMYSVSISQDEQFLFLYESETTSGNALYFKYLHDPNATFFPIDPSLDFDQTVVDYVNGKFLVVTNYGAKNNRLIAVDPKDPKRTSWKEIIPEQNEVLRSCKLGGNLIIANYMKNAYSKIMFYTYSGEEAGELKLPGIGTLGSFSSKQGKSEAFYSYSSYTVPNQIYSYNFNTRKSKLYREPNIKGLNFNDYITKQVFYKSKDGTPVSMFITHKKGIVLNGHNPALLYGYGGFNVNKTPEFSIKNMIWLEKGGVYAVANLRGGGEYGKEWHESGTKLQKQNVFDDFIAAAEFLIVNKYTSQGTLAIEGGSNGGLLVGAVANQRPDLFSAAIPHVGVLDMLRYQNFTIGRAWSADYGLSEDKEMFEYLYKYSPLHNIDGEANYPHILVLTGDHDDRVVPAHSFKYIAALQDAYTGENPVMIRIEKDAGHGAGTSTTKRIDAAVDVYAFIYRSMNIRYRRR